MELAENLRLGMRRLASGVCIISCKAEGQRYAMTASSVTSLSDSPASLLVCVNNAAAIQPFLVRGRSFAVNILGDDQIDVSNNCAGESSGEERFSVGCWSESSQSGAPFLDGAQAVFFCDVDNDSYQYGTHHIIIGRLSNVIVPEVEVSPLIYVDGKYQKIS